MSEPPALAHYTGGGDLKARVSTQRRADPPAFPVVQATDTSARVARVIARQQDPSVLPTYKSQVTGQGSILKVEGSRSEAPPLSDAVARSIEEARKHQENERMRPTRPSPPAAVATKMNQNSNSQQEPAKAKAKGPPPSNGVSSKKSQPPAPPTASPKPSKQGSAKKVSVSSPSPTASPKPVPQASVKKAVSSPAPPQEPAPASPIPPKAPPVHRPLHETWEFVTPPPERNSCCVIQ